MYIFLIECIEEDKLNVQTSEIQEAEWFSTEEAIGKIEYKGSRSLLKKGLEIFQKKYT